MSADPQVSDLLPQPGLDSATNAVSTEVQQQIDAVYNQITSISVANSKNITFVIIQLISACMQLNIPSQNRTQVMLAALDKFCTEHAGDKNGALFKNAELLIRFGLDVSTGALPSIPVEQIAQDVEAEVSSCVGCNKKKN